ncbi:MAG: rod shape-determining protein MreD [bacterium]|nr:rod shape-determining protein MreD [bacterium]
MIYFLWTFILFISLFLSVTFPPIFSLGQLVRIDVIIVLLSLYSLYLSPLYTLPAFFVAGLVIDSFFMTPLGYHSLLFLCISYAIIIAKGYIFKEKYLFQILVISMAAFLYRITDTFIFMARFEPFQKSFCNAVLSPVATVIFYSLIYVLVMILSKAVKRYGQRKQTP